MDSTQIGRIVRAHEVLGETAAARTGSTDDLLHGLGVDIGKLRYWLDDILNLVGELDQAGADEASAMALQKMPGYVPPADFPRS